jgi:hypothetical protein
MRPFSQVIIKLKDGIEHHQKGAKGEVDSVICEMYRPDVIKRPLTPID